MALLKGLYEYVMHSLLFLSFLSNSFSVALLIIGYPKTIFFSMCSYTRIILCMTADQILSLFCVLQSIQQFSSIYIFLSADMVSVTVTNKSLHLRSARSICICEKYFRSLLCSINHQIAQTPAVATFSYNCRYLNHFRSISPSLKPQKIINQ